MAHMNAVKTDMSILKDAIQEWFEALTGAIAHAGACHSTPQTWQPAQPSAPPLMHGKDAMFGQFMVRLLVVGGIAAAALYALQSVDWTSVGINLLLKAIGWL